MMLRFLIFVFLASPLVYAGEPPQIQIVWPREGRSYPAVPFSFTFGNVSTGSAVSVNGIPVNVHKNGAFLAYVPYSSGTYTLIYEAKNEFGVSVASRTIPVAEGPKTFAPGGAELDPESIYPAKDVQLFPGDWLYVGFRGSPAMKAEFRIKGASGRFDMIEKAPGIYEGAYWVAAADKGEGRWIEVEAKGSKKKVKARAKGLLNIGTNTAYQVAITSAEATVIKTAPGKGYDFFLPAGVKVLIAGKNAGEARALFGAGRAGWIPTDKLSFLPPGTPPPHAVLGTEIRTIPGADQTVVLMSIDDKVPFRVDAETDPYILRLTFYNTASRVNWIRYDPVDTVVKEIRTRQLDAESVQVEIRTHLKIGWGYDAQYVDGKFALSIRRPPRIAPETPVLKGRKIALDPGHSPGVAADGAIGPHATMEPDITLAIALKLKAQLEKDGATVVMTRKGGETVPLLERPKIAWKEKPDIYVSIHANAMGEEENPFAKPRGYMIFYYYPHSLALAQAVHKNYARFEKVSPTIPGGSPLVDEGFQYGDLAVIRATQMPAILTESAFLMLPEQEAMLMDPRHQELFADAMRDGIRSFFEEARRIQQSNAGERRAAY